MPGPDLSLNPAMPSEEALRQLLSTIGADIASHLAQVMADDDPTGPHKARVALRRLTTLLAAFAPLMRRSRARALRDEAKAIFRRLGVLRDAEVFVAGHATEDQRKAAGRDLEALRGRTRATLARTKAPVFADRLDRALAEGRLFARGRSGRAARQAPLARLAVPVLQAAEVRALSHGASLIGLSEKRRHDLRKDLKSLRYLNEFFAPLWPGPAEGAFDAALVALQDDLGALNDLAQARRRTGRHPGPEEAAHLALAEAHWQDFRAANPPWAELRRPA